MTFNQEVEDVTNWVWDEVMSMLDDKDDECEQLSAHIEVFLALAEIFKVSGLTKDQIHAMLDMCVFGESIQ